MKAALSFIKAKAPVRGNYQCSSAAAGPGDRPSRAKLLQALQEVFGHEAFRGRQEEAICAALEGKDAFVLMPTGGGKSCCYMLPAVVKPGVVLVVSPLIALMEDQVAGLKAKKIPAEYLSSAQTAAIKNKIHEDLSSGKPRTRLLYVTPELIDTASFQSRLRKLHTRGLLTLIAIDEAHCISSWGHDFRPSYRKLSTLRNDFAGVPIMALTATAAKRVQDDIVNSLNLHTPLMLQASFNRPNLCYEVRYKDLLDPFEDLLQLLQAQLGKCAIVYCLSRASCDGLAGRLSSSGVPCKAYHAGLKDQERSKVLCDWSGGKTSVVTATIAFGMGIDRADVRLVCHWDVPKSVEGFYQESGRAGRDGKPALSIVYYGLDDRSRMEFILAKEMEKVRAKASGRVKSAERGAEAFHEMVKYCEEPGCRRSRLLAYFGEKASPSLCQRQCDACRDPEGLSACLAELAQGRRGRKRPRLGSSATAAGEEDFGTASEFWQGRDDQEAASEVEEDISEDENEEVAAASHVKLGQKASLNQKLNALQKAEESFQHRFGTKRKEQGSSSAMKQPVPESSRQQTRATLQQRLESGPASDSLPREEIASAVELLEAECFKKFGRRSKDVYKGEAVKILRFLTTATAEQVRDKVVGILLETGSTGSRAAPANPPSTAPEEPGEAARPARTSSRGAFSPQAERSRGTEKGTTMAEGSTQAGFMPTNVAGFQKASTVYAAAKAGLSEKGSVYSRRPKEGNQNEKQAKTADLHTTGSAGQRQLPALFPAARPGKVAEGSKLTSHPSMTKSEGKRSKQASAAKQGDLD